MRLKGSTSGGNASVPVLPETIARNPNGAVTVRAVRLDAPLELDGTLDDIQVSYKAAQQRPV